MSKLKVFLISFVIVLVVIIGILLVQIFVPKPKNSQNIESPVSLESLKSDYAQTQANLQENLQNGINQLNNSSVKIQNSSNSSQNSLTNNSQKTNFGANLDSDNSQTTSNPIQTQNSSQTSPKQVGNTKFSNFNNNILDPEYAQIALQKPILEQEKIYFDKSSKAFLENDKQSVFLGYNVIFASLINYKNQNYWFLATRDLFNLTDFYLLNQDFSQTQKLSLLESDYLGNIHEIDAKNGLFKIEKVRDASIFAPKIEFVSYKFDLNKFLQNPDSKDFYEVL